MKKLYAFFFLFAWVGLTNAQTNHSDIPPLRSALSETRSVAYIPFQRDGDREVLWSEDFSNGFDSDNGDWTVEGADGDIWQYTDTVPPGCWSGSGDAAADFTTKDNGFMLYHPDNVNCNDNTVDPPLFDQTVYQGALVSPSIDLTDGDAVLVSFEHRFRYCCNTDFELRFSVSTDGGDNWEDFDVTGGTPVNDYNIEILTSLNISQIAANQSDVRFRFEWNATGTASHYLWALDDITVEIPVEHDMKLVELNYQQHEASPTADYVDVKHTIYQVSQVRPLNLQGFAVNNGSSEQTNVVMHATINTPNETISLSSPPQNVAVGDTGIFEIPYTPEGIPGQFELSYLITQDSLDLNPDDNADTLYFEVHESFFARDDRSREGGFTNYVDDISTGLGYTMTENATIYGIAVALDNSSAVGTLFNAQLLNEDFDYLTETDFGFVEEEMLNDEGDENFVQLPLIDPYPVVAGESIFPTFVFEGGAVDTATIALSGFCPDFTCYVWMVAATDGQVCDPCYYNSTPMIRLLMAENVSLQDVSPQNNITLGQNVPNPARDYTIVVMELEKKLNNAIIEIHEPSGRLVQSIPLGDLPMGQYTETIDTQSLTSGIYIYSLVGDDFRQSRRMTVVK